MKQRLTRHNALLLALLAVIFAAPRLLRLLSDTIWIEDAYYLYGPWLMAEGVTPYHEFSAVYLVLLEAVFAGLIKLFGPSIRIFEVVTALSVYATTWLVFEIGRRLGNWKVGLIAALWFSWDHLHFRYHVQHREIYTNLFAAIGYAWILWARDRFGRSIPWAHIIGCGLVLGVGALCKQSIATHVVPLFLFLVWERQWLRAVAFGVCFNGVYAVTVAAMSAWYGRTFYLQTVFFHFVKGESPTSRLFGTTTEVGPAIILGTLGCLAAWWMARSADTSNWRAKVWLMLVLDIAFTLAFFWRSLTFWPHYLLDVLIATSLGVGFAMESWLAALPRRESGRVQFSPAIPTIAVIIMVPSILGLALHPTFHPSLPGWERFGFGGENRARLNAIGRWVQANVPEDATIIAPDHLGLFADRMKLINFKDNLGNIMLLEQLDDQGRLEDARDMFAGRPFPEVRAMTSELWMRDADAAIADRQVALVIPNFEYQPDRELLRTSGYTLEFEAEDYEFWLVR